MAKNNWVGISTTNEIVGYKVTKQIPTVVMGCEGITLGITSGKYKQIMSGLHKFEGEFEESIDEKLAKRALAEMIARAQNLGANAVVGVRINDKGEKKHVVRVYGTPVVMVKK